MINDSFMKALHWIIVGLLLVMNHLGLAQSTPEYFVGIKSVARPEIIQLPDSVITFPITGLTYIKMASPTSGTVQIAEIELWVVDAKGKIIYNTIVATSATAVKDAFDAEYCRYMKLQSNYTRFQKHPTL